MHTASDADMEGVKQTNAGELAKTTSYGEWTAINKHRGCGTDKVYKQMGECVKITERPLAKTTSYGGMRKAY